MRSVVDFNSYYRSYNDRDFAFYDILSAVKGVPAKNMKVMLNEIASMPEPDIPVAIARGLLYKISGTPTIDAVPDLIQLSQNAEIAEAAHNALAFVPARTDTIRNLKRSLQGAHFAAAMGVDLVTDAADQLVEMLASAPGSAASLNAAWALIRISKLSPIAKHYIRKNALENPDKLIRSICLVGLAIESPQEWKPQIADEYESARDVEKFCLSIALVYASDAREMLSHLAKTSEDRLYVPFLDTCLQMLFFDAIKYVAAESAIFQEMLALTDDND